MAEKILILHVLTVFDRGGLETMLINWFRHADREKFEWHFLVQYSNGAYEEEVRKMGGYIHVLPPLSYNPMRFYKYWRDLKKLFRVTAFDIVHAHNNSFSYFPLKAAKESGVRIRLAHSHVANVQQRSLKVCIQEWLAKKLSGEATQLLACSEDAGKYLFNTEKFMVIPNAIDVEKFRYRQGHIKTLYTNLVYVARFSHGKNHLFLLKIFAEILKKNPHARLHLVGDGALKLDIERKITEMKLGNSIFLAGIVNEVHQFLQKMDVFIMPSQFEGLPVSLVEAQTAGLRCVISDGIPSEAILVPNNVKVMSLKKHPSEWADEILDFTNYERVDVSEIILGKGYGIVENTKILEQLYLKLLLQKL